MSFWALWLLQRGCSLRLASSFLLLLISFSPAVAVYDLLASVGFHGPFAVELAPYLEARRALEDGPNRNPTESMNGMVPGGVNAEVMDALCLGWYGHNVSKVTANDGQGCYVIKGPHAQKHSCVAIACLWHRYVNDSSRFNFPRELRAAWNESLFLSSQMKPADLFNFVVNWVRYDSLREDRIKAFERCNAMYGPGGSDLNRKLRQQNAKR